MSKNLNMQRLKRRKEDLKEVSMPQTIKHFSDAVLVRDKKQKQCRVIRSQSVQENNQPAVEVPEYWTEVIGWYGGQDVVRVKKTPEC